MSYEEIRDFSNAVFHQHMPEGIPLDTDDPEKCMALSMLLDYTQGYMTAVNQGR